MLLALVTASLGALGGLGGAVVLVPLLVLTGTPAREAAPLGLLSVASGSLAAGPRQLAELTVHHRLGVTSETMASVGGRPADVRCPRPDQPGPRRAGHRRQPARRSARRPAAVGARFVGHPPGAGRHPPRRGRHPLRPGVKPVTARRIRYERMMWALGMTARITFLAALAGTVLPGDNGRRASAVAVGLVIAAPLVRVGWLAYRWW